MVSDFILNHLSKDDLVSVSRVSKDLHALTIPLIYGKIFMDMGHSTHVEHSAIVAYHSAESEPALYIQILRSPDSPYDRAWKIPWQEID